ncbi:fimbria/pilus periplasmic chaperone, partial [Caballeronia sp. INML3]
GEPLPADKESIFYLNVLEVPPKPTGDEASANQLQLAFRTRIKFFYRPSGLKGQATDAPGQIVWHLKHDGGKNSIEASNPTQYHV